MRRHDLDLTSLLVGMVFLGVAAVYIVGQATGAQLDASWLGPLILVSLGLAGFVGGVARSWRRSSDCDEPSGQDAAAATPGTTSAAPDSPTTRESAPRS
jgi:hypothetical protein